MKPLAVACTALLIAATGDASRVVASGGEGKVVKVGLRKSTPGTFYLLGSVASYGQVDFLVDTGSSYTVINDRILESLSAAGMATFSRKIEGHMADGSTRVVSLYRIRSVKIGVDCDLANIEAAVFPGNTRPILGMNTLSRLAPFTFSADPPRLEFGACRAVATGTPAIPIAAGERDTSLE